MRSATSRRTVPSAHRRLRPIPSRNACGPRCDRPASASSTCSPVRSTMSGTSTRRRRSSVRALWPTRSSRPCAMGWKTYTPAMWRRSGSNGGATTRRFSSESSRPGAPERSGAFAMTTTTELMSTAEILGGLVSAMSTGRIRVIDLTQTLTPEFPQIALPPEMGQCWPFRIEEVSKYDERGPGWYWNNFSCGEHTGTHFDAPIHWISGRDLPNNSVDTIPVQNFVAPACVIDCSADVQGNDDYLLSVADIERYEAAHGRIPKGAWVLMRT